MISEILRSLLDNKDITGANIIATSRAIMAELYSAEDGHTLPCINTFVSIDDQTDYIILKNYGAFNEATPRTYVIYDDGEHFEGLGPPPILYEGSPEFDRDMEEVIKSFGSAFETARSKLVEYLTSSGRY